MIQSRLRRILIPLFVLCCAAALFGCNHDKTTAQLQNITDVFVQNKSVFFDDSYHGLDIIGLRDGDVVLYSESQDGEFSTTRLTYKDIGVYTIYIKVSRENCNDISISATLTISIAILDGISSPDSTVIYDGNPHNITVVGMREGDTVTYSLDGDTFSPTLELTDVGEYTVFYCVTRGYAEYRGSSALTVLPSVSGTYLNSAHGAISIIGFATSDGKTVSYDIYGAGLIDDKPFSSADHSITVDGIIYDRVADNATVYKLSVNNSTVLYFAQSLAVDVEVTFSESGASVNVGQAALTFPNYNYCESINSVVNPGVSFGMAAQIYSPEINIILSSRSPSTLDNISAQYIYDGTSHTISGEKLLYEVDGEFVSTPPEFTEVGTHTIRILSLKQGFLPAYAFATLVILPSPDGVYYSLENNVVVSITDAVATKNGATTTLEYADSGWRVDNVPLSSYTKRSTEKLFVFYVDGDVERVIIGIPKATYLGIIGNRAILLDNEAGELWSLPLSVRITSVLFNGVPQTPISDADSAFEMLYGIGIDDTERADGLFVIELMSE